jgi:hypothetical protein
LTSTGLGIIEIPSELEFLGFENYSLIRDSAQHKVMKNRKSHDNYLEFCNEPVLRVTKFWKNLVQNKFRL